MWVFHRGRVDVALAVVESEPSQILMAHTKTHRRKHRSSTFTPRLSLTRACSKTLTTSRMRPVSVGKEDAGREDASLEMKLAECCSVWWGRFVMPWLCACQFFVFFSITLILRQWQREEFLHSEHEVNIILLLCMDLKTTPIPPVLSN